MRFGRRINRIEPGRLSVTFLRDAAIMPQPLGRNGALFGVHGLVRPVASASHHSCNPTVGGGSDENCFTL
jgi:hypothetical protein